VTNENVSKASSESQAVALKLAKGIQRPEQTKAQTKLIAHGIEKGITEYKKQQKVLARERDKHRKKELKASLRDALVGLPWLLLAASWGYFLIPH
jgi:hypothetical protein